MVDIFAPVRILLACCSIKEEFRLQAGAGKNFPESEKVREKVSGKKGFFSDCHTKEQNWVSGRGGIKISPLNEKSKRKK